MDSSHNNRAGQDDLRSETFIVVGYQWVLQNPSLCLWQLGKNTAWPVREVNKPCALAAAIYIRYKYSRCGIAVIDALSS